MKKLLFFCLSLAVSATVFAQNARVQVIHNSADAAAAVVDIYLDGALALPDVPFRASSPYIDFPADVEVVIGVAPGDSTGPQDIIAEFPVTLADGETYVVVADGIVSGSGYNPPQPFGLAVYAQGREAATNPSNTDVLVHHGSTDAPTVDVVETLAGAGTIVDDISYTEFQGYLELPTADYRIEIRTSNGAIPGVAAYEAPLATLGLDGAALVVVASGFLDPSQNSDGPAFGLWVALPTGGPLVELPTAPLNVTDFDATAFTVYPNPTTDVLNIDGLNDTTFSAQIIDMQGRTLISLDEITNNTEINTTQLSTGMYQLIITDGNTIVASKKILKN